MGWTEWTLWTKWTGMGFDELAAMAELLFHPLLDLILAGHAEFQGLFV